MLAVILIVIGAGLMLLGLLMLSGWMSGKSRLFDPGVHDSRGNSKNDRMFIYLYVVALILAPLLGGAILIVFGLLQVK